MKVLKIILLFVAVLIILFVGLMWFAFRTTTEDITSFEPYKSHIGKTLVTKQICYIAKNRTADVNENPFLIKMTSRYFDEEVKEIYTVPIGTALVIEDAKAFISPFSTLQRKYILGKTTIKELNKTVSFEMYWDPGPIEPMYSEFGSRNDLMPWHDEILGMKYYLNGISDIADYPAQIKDPVAAARFRNTTYYCQAPWQNKVVADYTLNNTVYENDWNMGYITEKQFSVRVLVPKDEIMAFQLDEVFPEFDSAIDKIVFGHELTLSPNYYTLVAIKFKGQPNKTGAAYSFYNKETFSGIESALINYDLYGKKVDHILLSSQIDPDTTALKKSTIVETRITVEQLKNDSISTKDYRINESGTIVLAQ